MRDFVTVKNTREMILSKVQETRAYIDTTKATYQRIGEMRERLRILALIGHMLPEKQENEHELQILLDIIEEIQQD